MKDSAVSRVRNFREKTRRPNCPRHTYIDTSASDEAAQKYNNANSPRRERELRPHDVVDGLSSRWLPFLQWSIFVNWTTADTSKTAKLASCRTEEVGVAAVSRRTSPPLIVPSC